MDDLMKAIMAKAEQEVGESHEYKHQNDAKKVEAVEHHTDAKNETAELSKKADEEHPKTVGSNTKKEVKPAETVHVIQSEKKSAPPKAKKAVEPNWSAETQETSVLPAMLEPKIPEPKKAENHHNAEPDKVKETPEPPTPVIQPPQPKLESGIKLYVSMAGSFFGVAVLAAIYTALRITGVF